VAVCYNPPWIFAMFWKAISPFIDPSTYRKIRFVNPKKAKETERMSKMFDMSVIDADLGGEKAGPARCCPPRLPTHFEPSFVESNGIL